MKITALIGGTYHNPDGFPPFWNVYQVEEEGLTLEREVYYTTLESALADIAQLECEGSVDFVFDDTMDFQVEYQMELPFYDHE